MSTPLEFDRDAIVQTFLAECEEGYAAMEESLVALEVDPDDPEPLGVVFRAAHTLKGNAASLGFTSLADFAHVLEDLLDRLRERRIAVTQGLVTVVLRAIDVLKNMTPAAVGGNPEMPAEAQELMTSLAALAAGQAAVVEKAVPVTRAAGPRRRREDVRASTATLRVTVARLNRMLDLAGEIAIARGRARQLLESVAERLTEEVLESHRQADKLFLDLQEQILKVRMVPLGPLFRRYIRVVRDLAASNGKLARLVIEDADVEVDNSVMEHLQDPLTHMVRNALDHGIERPEGRRARGKPACGVITLRAYHEGGNIVIQVADDGSGLDKRRIGERARERGLAKDPESLPEAELYRLIFEPGFSTAEKVSELSGRGVGMDVVRRNIEALRGSVDVESRPGEGSTITVRLPLTLAIIQGFSVAAGGETYIIPLDAVLECVDLPEGAKRDEVSGWMDLRGEVLPYVRLRQLFDPGSSGPERESVVVIHHGHGTAGLAVDRLLGESQAVIKPLGRLFEGLPGIAGATILGDGQVALILDVPAILRLAMAQAAEAREVS